MHLICPTCNKRLQISDDKLPTDRSVRITCPSCEDRFAYDARHGVSQRPDEPQHAGQPVGPSLPSSPMDPNASLLALVCVDDSEARDTAHYMLTSLGYAPHVITTQLEALEALRQLPYRLFLLDATFDGTSIDTNIILTFVRDRPLDQRRYLFIVLCSPDLKTADAMAAYSQGTNLVINQADLPNCGPMLTQHMTEHDRLYHVFHELRKEMGKDA